MGELVSSVVIMVLEKLATRAYQDIAMAWGLKKEVESLQDSMRIINAFLQDIEKKQDRNNGITEWLQQLKHEVLNADDVLNEIECETLRNEVVKKYGSVSRKVHHFFSLSNKVAFSFKMAYKINEIKKRVNEIASLRTRFGLDQGHHAHELLSSERMSWRETNSHVRPSLVIGRDEEKEKIIDFLINSQSLDNGIDVIPIVGIGGLGKTTLAKLVYNDKRVKQHFDLQAWVCVSDDFNVKRITLGILKSLDSIEAVELTLQQVQTRLHNELHQKMFLIVMDDVWNKDRQKWLELTTLLSDIHTERNKNGSKIIITTRDKNVAIVTRTTSAPQFILRELSKDECLQIFLRKAFRAGEEEKYTRLVEIGKEIVKKCNGLPLALISLGCLLFSKTDESEWKRVRDSKIWELDEHNGILPALSLSYNHLPPQLKRCISYCSIFPKDYTYSCVELISFWLAHGLLQPTKETEEPEDLGDFYIKELFSRFFFQDIENDKYPGLLRFKMHDLVHDLAMFTMQSELAIVTSEHVDTNEKARHLVFSDIRVTYSHYPLRKVRTIGLWNSTVRQSIITKPFVIWISNEFKYLRVLDLRGSQLKLLPNCFSKMKHLKYLDLRCCYKLEELPASICKLQSLQAFSINACFKLKRLPNAWLVLLASELYSSQHKRLICPTLVLDA